MLSESRQNISTKESLFYCILGGIFVYFVTAIPKILLYLTPPKSSGSMDICLYAPPPPLKNAYIISFVIFTILGIYLLKKLNLKNRFVHFSLMGLILTIGGGLSTAILENIYYLILIGNSSTHEYYLASLKENWFDALLYDFRLISWLILFFLILVPFTITFLTTTSIIKRFAKRNSLS